MKKNVFGRKFKRDANERKALFRGLICSLILNGRIQTTLEKAKAIKGDIDKIVNKAKKADVKLAVQLLQRHLGVEAVNKVIKDIAPRFTNRNSGYTRFTKLGRRFSDNAQMVLMEWAVSKSQISNLKSQKLESGEKVQEGKTGFKKAETLEIPAKTKTNKETRKDKTKRKVVAS